MIRPFTCVCMLLAAGAGLYVYQEKHRAQVLDRQIMGVVKATEAARDRTGMLRAEWALLNEPERLAALADRHLALKPLSPTQFVQLADLGSHLPAPLAPDAPAVAMDDAAPIDAGIAQPGTAPPVAAVVLPVPPKAVLAAKAPTPPAVPVQVAAAKPARAAKPKPADTFETASALPMPAAMPAPRPVYASPAYSPPAYSPPAYSPYVTAVSVHAPTMQRVDAPGSSMIGSALGMAHTALPPPVPVSAASSLGSSAGR